MYSYDLLRVYEIRKTSIYTYKQYLSMTDASYRFQKHKMILFYPPYYSCKGDIKGGRVNFISMGFWSSTPNVSYWSYIESIWSSPKPPRLLEKSLCDPTVNLKNTPGVTYKRAIFQNATKYSEFLESHFYSKDKSTVLKISPKIIEDGLQSGGWYGIEALDIDLILIGIIFSLPIQNIYSSEFPKDSLTDCGLVDYFCVREKWRGLGVGSSLLTRLFELTSNNGRRPHIFASEGSMLFHKIPPFIRSNYIWREKNNTILENGVIDINRNKIISIRDIWRKNVFIAYNTKTSIIQVNYIYNNVSIHMLLKPTYELKNGKRVGEIISYWGQGENFEKLYDRVLDNIPDFEIFITHSSFPRTKAWNRGASFAYYPFHFDPGRFDFENILILG